MIACATKADALRIARRLANELGRPVRVLCVPRRNPWVTLSNRRRVELDGDGRVLRGGPQDFAGVHVRDLAAFARAWRPLRSLDCEAAIPTARRKRYTRKLDVAHALISGNRNLSEFLDAPWQEGQNLDTYEAFRGRKFKDWQSALLDAIPARGYWEDVFEAPRLVALRAAIEGDYAWPGGPIVPPPEALAAGERREAVAACEGDVARQISGLQRKARKGRLSAELEEAPF